MQEITRLQNEIKTSKLNMDKNLRLINEMYYEIVKDDFLPAKERYYLNLYKVDNIDYKYLYANGCKMNYLGGGSGMYTSPHNIKITSEIPKAYKIWNRGEAEKEDEENLKAIEFFKNNNITIVHMNKQNSFFMNNVDLSFKKPTAQKVFLYVPYEYRNDAKQDGFQWDNDRKNWYVMSNHPNLQRLKEKWHHCCFRDSCHGTTRKYNSLKDIITKSYEDYDEKKHGSYLWYSVNILGHE